MSAQVIDGNALSKKIREEIKQRVAKLQSEKGIVPGLAVIIVGENPASVVYVRNKEKGCNEVGFNSRVIRLPESTTQAELLETIEQLNQDKEMHGILVQLPLPAHMDELAVIEAISPTKDVDGFSLLSTGSLMVGNADFVPCTPKGCIALIESTGTQIQGKDAVVIGRSNIVGKPAAMLLLQKSATVTITHSKTKDLKEVCRRADIIVAAIGKAEFVTADMVKPGAVVIDVGINRCDDGKLRGDVKYDEVAEVASYITPVPGGVGPMTITMLLENTVEAAEQHGC